MTTSPTQAAAEQASATLATRDSSPAGLVKQYASDFTQVMPSHIKPDAWVRIAVGALKRGKKAGDGRYELEVAAANNPAVFLAALLDAARLGLEPGTEQYYLTPRKVKGQLEILGIVGYQGIIELIYRAGAVSSVVAECVYDHDSFTYQPGRDEVPQHVIDWDSEDRGKLRLVYAYARMKDGAASRVVVLNKADIARIKKSSQGASSEYSPWQTNEPAMWLKSGVRQLAKWVPTSSEYLSHVLDAMRKAAELKAPDAAFVPPNLPIAAASRSEGEILDAEIVHDDVADAELVEDGHHVNTGTGEIAPAEDAVVVVVEDIPPWGEGE